MICQLLSSQKYVQFKAALNIVQGETVTQSVKSGLMFSGIFDFF